MSFVKTSKSGKQLYKKPFQSYVAGDADADEDDEAFASEERSDDGQSIEHESESYITIARTTAAIGISPGHTKWVVNGGIIDTEYNTMPSAWNALLPAAKIWNMRDMKPLSEKDFKNIADIGSSESMLETLQVFFRSKGTQYTAALKLVPGSTPLIILRKNLDRMGLNCQML